MPRPAPTFTFLCGCLFFLSGCESVGPNALAPSLQASRGDGALPFSPAIETVAAAAIRAWHEEYAEDGAVYELDPYDRRIRRNVRNALRDLCPVPPPDIDREDTGFYTISIDQADLPQDNYAYAVIRIGNRFYAQEYAYIFGNRDEAWSLLDHYLISAGLLDTVMIDFSWRAYLKEKGLPEQTGQPVGN